jgi:hypothetical protein
MVTNLLSEFKAAADHSQRFGHTNPGSAAASTIFSLENSSRRLQYKSFGHGKLAFHPGEGIQFPWFQSSMGMQPPQI